MNGRIPLIKSKYTTGISSYEELSKNKRMRTGIYLIPLLDTLGMAKVTKMRLINNRLGHLGL